MTAIFVALAAIAILACAFLCADVNSLLRRDRLLGLRIQRMIAEVDRWNDAQTRSIEKLRKDVRCNCRDDLDEIMDDLINARRALAEFQRDVEHAEKG